MIAGWWIAACRPSEEVALEAERAAQPPAAEVEPAFVASDSGHASNAETARIPVFETGPSDSASACDLVVGGTHPVARDSGGFIYDEDSGQWHDSGSRWARLGRVRTTAVPGPCMPRRGFPSERLLVCPQEDSALRISFPPTDLPASVSVFQGSLRVHHVAIEPSTVTSAQGSLVVQGSTLQPEDGRWLGTPGWASPGETPAPGGLRLSEVQLLPRNYDLHADINCDGAADPYLDRFLELLNSGDEALNLGDHAVGFGSAEPLPLPSRVLRPGERVTLLPRETRFCASNSARLRDEGQVLYAGVGLSWVGGLEQPEGYRVLGIQRESWGLDWIEAPLPEPGQRPGPRQPLPVALVAGGGPRLRAQPAGDLDGDDLEDLLLLEPAAVKVSWGPFGPDRLGAVDPGVPLRQGGLRLADTRAVGDLDGDGRADLAVAGQGADPAGLELISLRDRSGLGEVWARVEEPCATDFVHRTQGMRVGDLTGDGLADLVVHTPRGTTGRLTLFAGPLAAVETTLDAQQSWTEDLYALTLSADDLALLVGDPVGDGQPRMVAHAPGRETLVLDPRLPGAVPTSAARSRESSSPERVALADLDGDGAAEVISVASTLLWATDVRKGGVYTRSSARWTAETDLAVRAPWGQLLVAPGVDGQPDLVLAGDKALMILPSLP